MRDVPSSALSQEPAGGCKPGCCFEDFRRKGVSFSCHLSESSEFSRVLLFFHCQSWTFKEKCVQSEALASIDLLYMGAIQNEHRIGKTTTNEQETKEGKTQKIHPHHHLIQSRTKTILLLHSTICTYGGVELLSELDQLKLMDLT